MLGNGGALDFNASSRDRIDGDGSFFLATDEGDAEFFAARRGRGMVIRFDVSAVAISHLVGAGCEMRPIPGGCPPYFSGMEFVVPMSAFPRFDAFRESGEIHVIS